MEQPVDATDHTVKHNPPVIETKHIGWTELSSYRVLFGKSLDQNVRSATSELQLLSFCVASIRLDAPIVRIQSNSFACNIYYYY